MNKIVDGLKDAVRFAKGEDVGARVTVYPSHLDRLQQWVSERVKTHGLEEIAFTPGRHREISIEEAAGVSLELLKGYDTGTDATEKP